MTPDPRWNVAKLIEDSLALAISIAMNLMLDNLGPAGIGVQYLFNAKRAILSCVGKGV